MNNIVRVISGRSFLLGLLAVILVLFATLPVYYTGYTIVLLSSIFMYIVMAVSWAIFSGPTGYISLATAAFFGVGIYTAAILGNTLPLLVVIVIGGLTSFCVALLVGALTLRLKGIYFAIFTFGLVLLIKHLLLWYEITYTHTRGRFVVYADNTTVYFIMLVILVMTMLTAYFVRRSRWGLALQSIGENEEAATHIGINVTMVKVINFAISAIFVGAAGAIMATRWTYIDPGIAFNPLFSFMPVLMAIFGGMGHLYGPVIGAVVFTYLEEFLITEFPELYMLIFGIILVVAILYMPSGIIGLIQKWWNRGIRRQHADT
ncbi:branched-chain amino acid ABC transporter permease [Chloroflexota bacterium]